MSLSIDVSNNNGHVNFDLVKAAGITVVGLKEDEGTWFRDSFFPDNFHQVVARNMVALPYHFARPDRDPGAAGGIAEADHFLSALQPYVATAGCGRPVLDYESVRDTTFAHTFCQRISDRLHVPPIIYCSGSRVAEIDADPYLRGHDLWVAVYGSDYSQFTHTHTGRIVMWQYTDAFMLKDGTKVDASHVFVSPAELLIRGKQPIVIEEVYNSHGRRIFRVRSGQGRLRALLRSPQFLRAVVRNSKLTLKRLVRRP